MRQQEIQECVKELAAKYPQVGLTFGYIGNCGPGYDDRSWFVFTKVERGRSMFGHMERFNYSLGRDVNAVTVTYLPSDPSWRGNYKLTPEQWASKTTRPIAKSDIENWIVNKVFPVICVPA